MTPEIMLEIFGYIGTAVVLLSFIMTDMKWMRAVNMVGGFISLIYAACVVNMPVVVLNASLITINSVQLVRLIVEEKRSCKGMFSLNEAYNEEEKKEENI